MRIWHQSFTVLQDLPAYVQVLKERIAAVVRPDTEVVLHGQIPGTYSSDYPGTDLAYGVGAPLMGKVNDLLGATTNPEVMRYGFLISPLSCVVAAILLWRGSRTLENLGQD